MIFFLYGQDECRLTQKLNEITAKYLTEPEKDIVFERIDIGENGERVFWNSFNQNSLFALKRVFILENISSDIAVKKNFVKKMKDLAVSDHTIFFVEKKEIKPSDTFLLRVKENGKAMEFSALSGKNLETWTNEQFALLGSSISKKALLLLLSRTKNNTWFLLNEIKKLSAFKKEVCEEDVDVLTKINVEAEIFQTIDSLLSINKKKALFAMQRYFDSKESLFYLVSMLAFQARNLLLVKISQERKMAFSGMHPFVFKKASETVRNVPLDKLRELMKKIFLADLEMKTGHKSPEQSIKFLATSI